ncbi:hypothetical protein ACG9XR_21345 [Acinetobacter guillouiae]|uniref:hypothetical protein n=1 Tax=Acinetobacter guillouiae TaxID=106649 RepID=UPI003AF4C263
MGGSKSQTVGYQYFAGLMVAIGNPIEQLLDINPAEKGWIMTPEQKQQLKAGQASLVIQKGEIFGGDKKEGGWSGIIDVFVGRDNQPQSAYLANQISEDVSTYPALSYLVFHGTSNNSLEPSIDRGFYLVSMSGMMKEFMLWVKRIHVKNDGTQQWYAQKAPIGLIEDYTKTTGDEFPKRTFLNSFGYLDGNITSIIGDGTGIYTDSERVVFTDQLFRGRYSQIGKSVSSTKNTVKFSNFGFVKVIQKVESFAKASTFNEKFYGDIKIISRDIYEYDFDPEVNDAQYFKYDITYVLIVKAGSGIDVELISSGSVYYKHPVNPDVATAIRNSVYTEVRPIDGEIDSYYRNDPLDINPVHKIREILTDYTAMGKPESDINDDNFKFMADRIFDEGLGISWCVQQKSCKEAIEELEYHIEGGMRINRQTGLYEVILFRDDLLNLHDALHFDESNIKSFQPDIINAEDQINAVNVSFYDRVNIKDSSFSLSDVGSFHTIDHENAEDLKFPYFMNRRNAEMVANWKLKQLSTMAWKGTFTTGKYEARKLNKYDVVLLSWKSKNIINLPVRVMNINLGNGRDNTVTLDFVEVVPYSNISYSSINVDPNPNSILPPQPNSSIVFEMPYFEAVQRMGQTSVDTELANNPEIGYLMAAAIKPQNNSLNALLFTDGGTGIYTNFEESGVVEYCAACYLDQDISQTDTDFAVKSVKELSRVKLGTLVQLGDELLVYKNYDAETKVLTVKRGALDTIPKPHLKDAVFYFWDDSSGLDSTTYIEGETVKAQVLTTTPSGIENLYPGNVQSLEIVGRANRPYPPANVKINGKYWPEFIDRLDGLMLTWSHRNKIQQTGGDILGWFDGDVLKGEGTTYTIVLRETNGNEIRTVNSIEENSFFFKAGEIPVGEFVIELTSVNEGVTSYQFFSHKVDSDINGIKFIFDKTEIYNPPESNMVNFTGL